MTEILFLIHVIPWVKHGGSLDKAWIGYVIAKKLENNSDMKLYASIIQRLEKELNIEVNDFPKLGLCVCDLEDNETKENEDY